MSATRCLVLRAGELAPFVPGLRAIERTQKYPIADGADHFTIDHGEAYHPFFTALGDPRFLVALDGERVVGTLAGVLREASVGGRTVPSAYVCDLKVDREYRGGRVTRAMYAHGLWQLARDPELRQWRVLYGAAMRGARGDVFRSMKHPLHPARIFAPWARLHVYFATPSSLAKLPATGAPVFTGAPSGVDLSPEASRGPITVSTRGRKDFRIESTGLPWALVHLPWGPARWGANLGAWLREGADAVHAHGDGALACFALDERFDAHVRWLAKHGVEPGAVCTVYACALPPAPRRPAWVHLATHEI